MKRDSGQGFPLKDTVILAACIVGIVADLTVLRAQSNGILSVLIVLFLFAYHSWFKKTAPPNTNTKYRLFFCTPEGKPRNDLRIETPFGVRTPNNGGLVTVSDRFIADEYEICIFSSNDDRFIRTETIVRCNNEPVMRVVV